MRKMDRLAGGMGESGITLEEVTLRDATIHRAMFHRRRRSAAGPVNFIKEA
jgi:hypothetical protein